MNKTKGIESVLEAVSAVLMGGMVCVVFLNVVLRFVFRSGLPLTDELARIMLTLLVLIGSALALLARQHITMTLVVARIPAAAQRVVAVIVALVMIAGCVLLTTGSWTQAGYNFGSSYPISGLPSATIYVAAMLCGGLMILILLWQIFNLVAGRWSARTFFGLDRDISEIEE